MSVVIIQTSCPDAASAETIANALVQEGLAACVSRIPGMVSTYRWQGQLQIDAEELLLIKTMMHRKDAVFARVQELHPYELPELIVVEAAAAHGPYRDWIAAAASAP
ncbi:MAG: divalent-cation tolerance protein CutA [Dokdonella sp.]